MNPKVSIITVVYNGERYLEETINSVINQDYSNTEYLVIDGGSTDGTIEIIKRYQDRIDYWVSESDKGIYDAMNKGVRMSSGEYILFMNSDDYFHTARSVSLLVSGSDQYDVVYGDTLMLSANGQPRGTLGGAFSKRKLYFKMIFSQQACVVKRQLFLNFGFFRLDMVGAADYDWIARVVVRHNASVKYVDAIISDFRMGGTTYNVLLQNYIDGFKISTKYFPFYISFVRIFKLAKDVAKFFLLKYLKRNEKIRSNI